MKKVRFETANIADYFGMSDSECHSPRPFENQLRSNALEPCYEFVRVLPYSNDPVQRFETSNSSPYPSIEKSHFPRPAFREIEPILKPSNDLDLSLLDASNHEPRRPFFNKTALKSFENKLGGMISDNNDEHRKPVLSAIEENSNIPPNVLVKDNSFFIKRDNLDKYHVGANFQKDFNGLNMGKENNPYLHKAEIMKKGIFHQLPSNPFQNIPIKPIIKANATEPLDSHAYNIKPAEIHCPCHHCVKPVENIIKPKTIPFTKEVHKGACYEFPMPSKQMQSLSPHSNCHCSHKPQPYSHYHETQMHQNFQQTCACGNQPQNTVDKKTWAIEKFEQRKQSECMEVEKQTNVTKEKREPTVADLFKIIKLQNEQLQLLQEKVDKFITASQQNTPTISCSSEQVSEKEELKMSIGVMTSFEMVRTSTVINKEVIKQTNDNQIQCNRSQISIKEVVSKPTNLNFLDGIMPVNNPPDAQKQAENGTDKTLNELSLCDVQVDNATTPNLSPEQTLYLDVRDYSDSEASSNDQSNVGWTYYNKVMTHVNGMLQDSEMPSSASAMFRNMRQQCVQMHVDKSNISVTTSKRVKFGDDPLGIHQPHLYASTDTSLKMNQLAAKYLKNMTPHHRVVTKAPPNKPVAIDMSFGTRNYMERHKLLKGDSSKNPQPGEIPKFLDITALKQQPKLL